MENQKLMILVDRLDKLNDKVNLLASLLDILGGEHPLVLQMLKDLIAERDEIDEAFQAINLEITNTMSGTSLNS